MDMRDAGFLRVSDDERERLETGSGDAFGGGGHLTLAAIDEHKVGAGSAPRATRLKCRSAISVMDEKSSRPLPLMMYLR